MHFIQQHDSAKQLCTKVKFVAQLVNKTTPINKLQTESPHAETPEEQPTNFDN